MRIIGDTKIPFLSYRKIALTLSVLLSIDTLKTCVVLDALTSSRHNSNRELVGQIPFAVSFDVNGKPYKRVWATVTIEVLAEVVVTKKPLGRHKPITEDDITVLKMDLAKVPSDVITDPEVVLGKRTKRAIGSSTVLRANQVEFPPLVKRGDVVVIIAETQSFKITALGQVKKKGAIGDRIPVINFESKKVLYARVVDSNTVKVDF